MSTRTIDFERAKVYEEVWTQPLAQVAQKYGVASADIKRVAQTLSVPLPPSGHWTKIEHGKGMATPPLPEFDGNATHQLTKWVDDEAEEVARRFEVAQANAEPQPVLLPVMRSTVAECLPLIKRMAARLKKGYKDTRNWPAISGMGQFEIRVSPQNQERALLTFDLIIRHCAASGLKLTSDESAREPATFVIDGISFTLRIFESGRREERELTVQEKADVKANPNGYHYLPNRWTFHSSNQLRLEVHDPRYRTVEFTIQDGSDSPLAERIADVPQKLREHALKEKLRQDVRAEERERDEARREIHAKKVEAQRHELERLKHFEEVASQAERATRLRSLALTMETSGRFADAEGQEKLAWIRNAADWLDPIIHRHWPVVDDV